MSIQILFNGPTYDLTGEYNGILSTDQGVIYLLELSAGSFKLGEIIADSGVSADEAVRSSYSSHKRTGTSNYIIRAVFIFNLSDSVTNGYDNQIRRHIVQSYKNDLCSFDANVGKRQVDGTNGEALIGFDPDVHMEELANQIKEYFGINQKNDIRVDFAPRYGQQESIDSCVGILSNHSTGLLAAYTGIGKTLMSVATALRVVKSGVVLVTTPMTDTIESFISDINSETMFLGVDREITYRAVDSDNFDPSMVSNSQYDVLFLVLSVQDLFYNEGEKLEGKYECLTEGVVKLWIQDERHHYYDGQKTSQLIENIDPEKTLQLTATPYGITDDLSDDQIHYRGILWGLKNQENTGIPDINIEVLSAHFESLSSEYQDLYSVEEGFHPDKFFHPDQGLSAQCKKLFIDLYGHGGKNGKKRTPLSISGDSGLCDMSKQVGLVVLPSGDNETGAKDYINQLASMLNECGIGDRKYISSYELQRIAEKSDNSINDAVEDILREYAGVTILTCRKFLTGTNIIKLGHIALLSKIGSPKLFEQLLGRTVRVCEGKTDVKMYCMVPKNDLIDCIREVAVRTSTLGGGQVKELLDCLSLSQYNGLSFEAVSTEEVLSKMHRSLRGSSLRTTIKSALSPDVLEIWRDTGVTTDKAFKSTKNKTSVSEDNGSKVADILKAKNAQKTKKEIDEEEMIINCISMIIDEFSMLSYIHQSNDLDVILEAEQLNILFPKYIEQARVSIKQNKNLYNTLSTMLGCVSNLDILTDHDKIFVNTDIKKKGLHIVFLTLPLSRTLVESVRIEYNKGARKFLVVNALSGILPLLLRQEFPDAEIHCLEYEKCNNIFSNHLISLGFPVHYLKDTLMHFDLTIGNPPYGNRGALAVKFVNKGLELSGRVDMVLPLSFTKPSIQNSIDPYARLVLSEELPLNTFPMVSGQCVKYGSRPTLRGNLFSSLLLTKTLSLSSGKTGTLLTL